MTMFEHDNPVHTASWPQVLARYAPRIRPTDVESLGNRGGFSGAAIWRVKTEQGEFALRRWPMASLPRERILGLHRLLEYLYRDQLEFVAAPVSTSDGSTLVTESGYEWQLESWKPGLADFRSNPTALRLATSMHALARWHLSADRHVPAAAQSQWFQSSAAAESPAVVERLEIIQQIQEPALQRMASAIQSAKQTTITEPTLQILNLLRQGLPQIHRELMSMRNVKVRLQPCLRDVWHDHLLFSGDVVTGLIDPSACRRENVAADLARLIGSLIGDDRNAWNLALTEYQRYRNLRIDELKLIEVLDHSGVILSGWTWLQWIYNEKRAFAELEPVQQRLDNILQRMEQLIGGGRTSLSLII
ncbi:MAG TPA: phosphotransferase [Schlesneria sp.]|jgi:Ser/Thr protein kinase RdoA (MazF antagonist)